MAVFDHREFDDHESLHFFNDASTGLNAIIAVHSTALGPAAGGCRRWVYASDGDALTDALRLSRGMTYKNAVAGLRFGGGKAVILSDGKAKSPQLFAAFGRAVESLQGQYITAEDVGMSVEDMHHVHEQTQFVSGLPQVGDDAGGDPSPWTAVGVYLGLRAAVQSRLGKDTLDGVRVAVQGVGHVGAHLCEHLIDAGAQVFVADVNSENLAAVCQRLNVTQLSPQEILFAEVDVLAPCALGNIFTSENIARIQATVIAGAANNQLADAAVGQSLSDRDILYAPDYVINAGGIVSVAHEYYGNSSSAKVQADVEKIPQRLQQIFADSTRYGKSTNTLADDLAKSLIANANTNKD